MIFFVYLQVSDWFWQSTLFHNIWFIHWLILIPPCKNLILWFLVLVRILLLVWINRTWGRSFKPRRHTFWKNFFFLDLIYWRISVPKGSFYRDYFIFRCKTDFLILSYFLLAFYAIRNRIIELHAVSIIAYSSYFEWRFQIFL